MQKEPFFSVIIPTRERADTLFFCLKSCIAQSFSDVEFLVSDNFSGDNTRDVVDSFGDSRIRRVDTGRRVSMRENYEFALLQAVGRYLIIIGDDDALIPNGLAELKAIILSHAVEAVKWATPVYYWPNYQVATLAGKLSLTLNDDCAMVDGRGALNAMRLGLLPFPYMPMIYHGAVSKDLVRRIRAKSGLFFNSDIPDVYSGIAIAASVKEYLFLAKPVSMHGASSHSSGVAIFNRAMNLDKEGEQADSPVGKFLREVKEHKHHPDFMPVSEMPAAQTAYTTECLYQVRDAVLGGRLFIPAWYRLFLMVRELGRTSGDFMKKVAPLGRYAARNRLTLLFKLLCRFYFRRHIKIDEGCLPRWTPSQQRMVFDTQSFGIRDVYAASLVVAQFFQAIPALGRPPRVSAGTLFISKSASVLVGWIFRKVYPRGGYMR